MPTCLVVDDVTVTRFSARTFLENLGINVLEAEDGDFAISVMSDNNIDVVLLDWHLKKKSGIDLLGVIRDKYGSRMKVIMFSGVESADKITQAKDAGANGFISKPTTQEKIEAEFRAIGII